MQNTERASFERAPHRNPDDLQTSLLYPLMLIAAIAVIVFSIVGIASLTGVMPRALSTGSHGAATDGGRAPAARSETPRKIAAAGETRSGVIKSIRAVQTRIPVSGSRAFDVPGREVAGGGRSRLPVVAGGAYHAGHDPINAHVTYRVRVLMDDDGRLRTFYEASQPVYGVGEKVLVTERTILAEG